ncbi:MAG: VWA domain-containing protein [Desulfobacteraceae bacterium]|nr:VWA domain-containing protein [Desulfobacteraceae bacterium]
MLHNNVSVRKCILLSLLLLIGFVFLTATCSFALSQPASSAKLISEAYKSGELDYEHYINYSLYTIFAPDKLPKNFRSEDPKQVIKSATSIIEEALRNPLLLSDDNRHILYRPAGPTDSGDDNYYGSDVVVWSYNTPGGHFKIWYTEDNANGDAVPGSDGVEATVPQYVIDFGAYHDNVWTTEIDTMNYNEPASDNGEPNNGGDGLFDVYIINMASYGYCSHFCNDPVSYIVVENDYTGFPSNDDSDDQKGAMKVTAAHEFHHAIQNNYNDHCAAGSDLGWYMEATSTWMEDQVYDAVNDNLMYVDNFLDAPETSLNDSTDKGYGDWIFNEFLENKFGSDTVRLIWEKIESMPTDKAIDAISSVLVDKGSKLKDAFTEFCGKNYAQEGFYKDALRWKCSTGDDIKIENKTTPHTLDYSTSDSHILTEQTTGKVNHLASRYYKFVPGPTLESPVQLTIKVNGPDGKDVSAIVIAKKKDGTFVEYPFTLGALDKNGEVGISGFCTKEITEVVLVLVNYSKSTDDLEFKYEAFLCKGVVFCIDDTGSMGGEIAYAKAAAIKVLDDNKAAGNVRYYTLLTFKDGAATLRGQSSDEDTMKGYINALYASGGPGCPESSLTAIRQGADLSKGSDILMMTDASSNSYGVDNTYAEWGEVFATIFKLLENKCHLHSIVYSTCYHSYSSGDGDDEWQCPECYYDGLDIFSLGSEDPSGEDGYNRASTETGGLYFRISSSDTEKAAEIILREASSDSTICFYDGSLSGGDTSYTVPVDDTITQLQVVLNGNVGSSLSLEVKNPAGEIVDNDTAGVSVISVSGSTFYLIEETALASGASFWSAGDWTAKVSGNGSYRFSASCSTANPMDYTGDTSVGVGGALSLKASIRMAVTGIGFQLVELDGSGPMDVTLTSSDGLSYIGTHIMDTVGSYRFRATGDGNYQRMYSSKITVGNLDVVAPAAKNVAPGTSLTHQFQVKNLGTEEDTYDLFATSSLGWSDLTGIAASITIAAGGTENIDIPVTVPADATTGQVDVLSVQAVSQANSLINDTDDTETRVGTIYDFDGNGVVDVVDIMKVASRWNTKAGDADYDATYDLDGDGDIDIIDIMMVAAQWGWTT